MTFFYRIIIFPRFFALLIVSIITAEGDHRQAPFCKGNVCDNLKIVTIGLV